jgi:hypothetical protein
MFPYSAIAAANLLNNKKGERQPNPPKISTLGEFTQTSPEDFYALLVKKGKTVGIFEMADMITKWQDFDNLTPNQKTRFVTETETPDYYSFANRVKRFLSKF